MHTTLLLTIIALLPGLLAPLTPILTTGVSYVATMIVRALLPKLPGWLIPIIASLLAAGTDTVSHFAAGTDLNTQTALLLGLGATGLNQIKVQLTKPADPAK